jgi:hypothetical protein
VNGPPAEMSEVEAEVEAEVPAWIPYSSSLMSSMDVRRGISGKNGGGHFLRIGMSLSFVALAL